MQGVYLFVGYTVIKRLYFRSVVAYRLWQLILFCFLNSWGSLAWTVLRYELPQFFLWALILQVSLQNSFGTVPRKPRLWTRHLTSCTTLVFSYQARIFLQFFASFLFYPAVCCSNYIYSFGRRSSFGTPKFNLLGGPFEFLCPKIFYSLFSTPVSS